MATVAPIRADEAGAPAEESLIILQSLICLLREKNLLTRADIEELCHQVERRAHGESSLPCCAHAAQEASGTMRRLTGYIGRKYGGRLPRG